MKHERAHYLRISKTEEIDGEVRQWACDAHRVGQQEYSWQRGGATCSPSARIAGHPSD
jgi:hypothetical protein